MNNKYFIGIIITFALLFCISNNAFATYISPYPEPTSLIKYGSTGIYVKWVQDMLKQNGYQITIDGEFGSNTKNAVMSFQSQNNLEVDGIVGSNTRNTLKKKLETNNTYSNLVINVYLYTTTNVNFRSGPSTSNNSYSVLAPGTKVFAYQSRSDGWTYVSYNNKYGYISSKYLQTSYQEPTSQNTTSISSLPTFNRNAKDLLTIIKNCKAYYANNNFYYSLANGVRSIPADKSTSYSGKYYVDCSSFVSWVLYEYGLANGRVNMKNYFSYQRNSTTFANIGANGGNDYLKVVYGGLNNARAGDILVTNGHVEFLSSFTRNSNGTISLKVYNCGSDGSIKIAGISNSATRYESEIKYILRVK